MNRILMKTAIAAIASAAMGAAASAQTIAIMDARVLTGAGEEIENGDVIIENGRIAQVGADLSAPEGARVIDGEDLTVTPGIFAPISTIGLEEIGLDAEANDAGPSGEGGATFPLGAALNAADAFRPDSSLIAINRAGGVTRAVSVPNAGRSLFGGRALVIDMTGRANSVTKANAAQVAVLGYGGAARAGDTRMGSWALMREYLDEAKSYAANPNEYARRARPDRFEISDLKALGPVVGGEQPLLVYIDGANELRNLIRLKNAYQLRVIVVGGAEAWRVAPQLAAANIPVILDPLSNLPSQFEQLGATLENAARLEAAGVQIAFYNPPGFGAHNLRFLRQQAGNAVASGLPYNAAIRALTLSPAIMYGLDDRLGSLEAGKTADVVVWDGDPLEVTSSVEAVFINGVEQDLGNRQTALRNRYRDLERGDLPHAYRGGE